MREQWNRQAITTQWNASPLPGCFSTPPFISLPSAAFNRLPSQKNCFHVAPPLPDRPFQCSITTPFPPLHRTPAPEEKYIEGRRKKNDSEERRFNSLREVASAFFLGKLFRQTLTLRVEVVEEVEKEKKVLPQNRLRSGMIISFTQEENVTPCTGSEDNNFKLEALLQSLRPVADFSRKKFSTCHRSSDGSFFLL
ncbi:hypothetical protein CEXT_395131 [Caerostris extrusa]|uniref:Uncharacterized protein n=1 Tax=Caerostris extrusa TaxID=172846 RepID=A0AAV4W8P7_CAEEX|nr:hypothetical protein CEXT_395131 [Caerostris extrusa]